MFCDNNSLVSGIKNGIDRGDLGIAVFATVDCSKKSALRQGYHVGRNARLWVEMLHARRNSQLDEDDVAA